MKLKDLKPILNSERAIIYTGCQSIVAFAQNSLGAYEREGEGVELDMFDTFGEFEIEQLYSDDSQTLNIELISSNKETEDIEPVECQECGKTVNELIKDTNLCIKCYEEDIELLNVSNENNFNISIMYRKKWKDAEKENKGLKEELLKLQIN